MFDRITEGEYTLWVDDVARARGVAIAGGKIAELDWTTSSAQAAAGGEPGLRLGGPQRMARPCEFAYRERTFSSDIAYSERPAASRASSKVSN